MPGVPAGTLPAGGVSGDVVLASQTWKPVPPMAMVPVALGVGRSVVPPVPAASCTR